MTHILQYPPASNSFSFDPRYSIPDSLMNQILSDLKHVPKDWDEMEEDEEDEVLDAIMNLVESAFQAGYLVCREDERQARDAWSEVMNRRFCNVFDKRYEHEILRP